MDEEKFRLLLLLIGSVSMIIRLVIVMREVAFGFGMRMILMVSTIVVFLLLIGLLNLRLATIPPVMLLFEMVS